MKIRTICCGVTLLATDFLDEACTSLDRSKLAVKLDEAFSQVQAVSKALSAVSYEVQTVRMATNTFEAWLLPLIDKFGFTVESIVNLLAEELARLDISFFSVGCCSSIPAIKLLPKILAQSERISGSVLFSKDVCNIAPDANVAVHAAHACLEIAEKCGDLGNFRYCASFNCKPGIPFFPAAYHEDSKPNTISIGLENGDLLFLAFYGAETHTAASANLEALLKQIGLHIQGIVEAVCSDLGILYGGLDASINPGLTPQDSAVAGLENIILPRARAPPNKRSSSVPPRFPRSVVGSVGDENRPFGSMGTLAAVSTVTKATKALPAHGVKLVGYSGLMLPVMEDLQLAENATSSPALVTLRDLLTFSAVCGVGLDTVPLPGNLSSESLAGVYMEVGALAFRLDKPLTCRVLPMAGLEPGDMTDVHSPYLCQTRVFSVDVDRVEI